MYTDTLWKIRNSSPLNEWSSYYILRWHVLDKLKISIKVITDHKYPALLICTKISQMSSVTCSLFQQSRSHICLFLWVVFKNQECQTICRFGCIYARSIFSSQFLKQLILWYTNNIQLNQFVIRMFVIKRGKWNWYFK